MGVRASRLPLRGRGGERSLGNGEQDVDRLVCRGVWDFSGDVYRVLGALLGIVSEDGDVG